jgi:hypothetical protein
MMEFLGLVFFLRAFLITSDYWYNKKYKEYKELKKNLRHY